LSRKRAIWGRRRRPPLEDWLDPLIGSRPVLAAPPDGRDPVRPAGGPGVAKLGAQAAVTPGPTPGRGRTASPELRCLIVTRHRLEAGGLEEMVAFLARGLPAYGIGTAVLRVLPGPTARLGGRLAQSLQADGIEVEEVDEADAAAWIRRWHPDVMSGHGRVPDRVLTVAQEIDVPYVETLHGMPRILLPDWRSEAERAAKVATIVAVSDIVRRQYLGGNGGFPPGRIITIPNGVDDEHQPLRNRALARHRLGLTEEYLFVSLGRHCLQKNTYGLLAAFAAVARGRPEAHLVVAGKLDHVRYHQRVLRLRDSLPCRDRIHLRDHSNAPFELLAAADGFVLDSFHEGWPLASMEALAAGVPVVLSDAGGAREQVGDNPTRGRLVANPLGDPGSVSRKSMTAAQFRPQANQEELAAAMDNLLTRRDEYRAGREQLAAESARRFSGAACLARHAAVLRATASGSLP
jgi:glycosyltransferase involved in cell wall biosynthesis